MPELPEVEVTIKELKPKLVGRSITRIDVRNPRLRFPIPSEIQEIAGASVESLERRAKYIYMRTDHGTAVVHLGMTGHLSVVPPEKEIGKHDHWDMLLSDGNILRYNDVRRFGALLWTKGDPAELAPLRDLGPEPLSDAFNPEYLEKALAKRVLAIKCAIMDNKIVVGVGNIYANESLFRAGIDPRRESGSITEEECSRLTAVIKDVISEAIESGGSTIKDFYTPDGEPGYFAQKLEVYGRTGEPCVKCGTPIEAVRLGQRSTFFCPKCQK